VKAFFNLPSKPISLAVNSGLRLFKLGVKPIFTPVYAPVTSSKVGT